VPSGGITRQPGGVPGDSWTWQDSEDISALVDSERYLAHVIEIAGRWLAFDATHRNVSGRGFAFLGARDSLAEAKDVVESALRGERVRSAVVDTNNVQPLPRLAATLEEAALHLEWASLRREWRRTQGMARKLVTTVDGILLSAPQPDRWAPVAETSRQLARAVLGRRMADIQKALTIHRAALASLREDDSPGVL